MSEQQATTEKKQKKPPLTPEQKRAKLEAEIARKKAQLAALAKKDRKRATHDKVLIGALVVALAAKGYNMLGQLLEFAETYKIIMAEKDKTRLDEINAELEKNKKSETGPETETPKTPEPETPKPEPETPETPKEEEKAEKTETQEEKRAQIAETLNNLFSSEKSSEKKPLMTQKREAQANTQTNQGIFEDEDEFPQTSHS